MMKKSQRYQSMEKVRKVSKRFFEFKSMRFLFFKSPVLEPIWNFTLIFMAEEFIMNHVEKE